MKIEMTSGLEVSKMSDKELSDEMLREELEKELKAEKALNAELNKVICTNEYYQNGYKQGKLDESKKREVEIFEIQGAVELRDARIYDLHKEVEELEKRLEETENVKFIGKLKKYAKLLQDICTVMGNDIYMVSAGLESRVKNLWDSSEENDGFIMVEDIENRLLEIKPQDWAEIEGW